MKVRAKSLLTGKYHVREIDVNEQDLQDFLAGKKGLVQEAFPHLPPDDLEFILTGITPEEWAFAVGGDEK